MIDSAQELKEAIVGARVEPTDHLIAVHWMKLGRAIAEIERLRAKNDWLSGVGWVISRKKFSDVLEELKFATELRPGTADGDVNVLMVAVPTDTVRGAAAEIERLREEVKFVREEMVCLKAHRDELQASKMTPLNAA